ncbi:MAG TPA: TetR/AcrR family transcriptional regulator [Candidatus Dietzia intestinipullorum]|nr:TetR/AcrR family transcriptional regulator [Candidatus Dietzia intestinipullorum]
MTRRLPADQRRAQLLRSALEIAEREGLTAVTVRGVAERAGVSLGVVHYCYTDKEELLREVINTVNADVHQAAKAFVSVDFGSGVGGTEGLRQRLYEAIDLIWTVISASPDRQLLTYEIVSYSLRTHGLPEIGLAGDQQSSNEEIVRSVLERTAESSGMRWTMDIDDMIRVVMCMIDGIGLRWQIYRDDDEANELLHRAVDLVVADARPAEGA